MLSSIFPQTHKVGNNGINANFAVSFIIWITFQGCRLISLYNLEWHNQNEVANTGILVLLKVCEKLYW